MITQYIWYRLTQRCRKQNKTEEDKYNLPKIFSELKSVIIKYSSCILEMIPIDPEFTERCTAFEYAATYDYARCVVENKKGKRST